MVTFEGGKQQKMRKKNILLVEHDARNQKVLLDLLNPDYECVSAQNGKEGLSYLENNPGEIDLIITELEMPVMNGFEMLEHIQEDPMKKSIPVLIETSPEQKEEITRAFKAGADDILSKPLCADIAQKRISNILSMGNVRKLHNVMEDLIQNGIDENITNLGICSCPICRKDLLTLTLNNVKPKYVSTEKGQIIAKAVSLVSREENTMLLAQITHYAKQIRENPRHG